MKNKIFINFFSAKSGGGKVIFDNFMSQISVPNNVEVHVVCPPGYNIEKESVIQVALPWYSKFKLLYFFVYFFFFPRYVNDNSIYSVLNFGDLVLPRIKKQVYFFDWAYLVITDKEFWKGMSFRDKCVRKIKSLFIRFFQSNNALVVVQSDEIAASYRDVLGANINIKVMPTPVVLDKVFVFDYGVKSNDFVYLSNYAPHKNFEIIPKVAALLKARNVNARILLTLDENSPHWIRMRNNLEKTDVSDYVKTIGAIPHHHVFSVLSSCRALFFPSKLESYGIPLIEAMISNVPVMASNTKFIKSVCKESVIYFDPEDHVDMVSKIEFVLASSRESVFLSLNVDDVLAKLTTWNEFSASLLKESLFFSRCN